MIKQCFTVERFDDEMQNVCRGALLIVFIYRPIYRTYDVGNIMKPSRRIVSIYLYYHWKKNTISYVNDLRNSNKGIGIIIWLTYVPFSLCMSYRGYTCHVYVYLPLRSLSLSLRSQVVFFFDHWIFPNRFHIDKIFNRLNLVYLIKA